METDPEIEAMTVVAGALSPLDQEVQARVLEWAAKRYGVALAAGSNGTQKQPGADYAGADELQDERSRATERGNHSFEDFSDLYDAASPDSEADRALVGAYWFQVVQGEGTFKGFAVNEALRNMGHGVSNITRAYDGLQARQPALVRQLNKSGRSKQARKTYKLTNAGIKTIEAMIQ
jgi:hypothetical protein